MISDTENCYVLILNGARPEWCRVLSHLMGPTRSGGLLQQIAWRTRSELDRLAWGMIAHAPSSTLRNTR